MPPQLKTLEDLDRWAGLTDRRLESLTAALKAELGGSPRRGAGGLTTAQKEAVGRGVRALYTGNHGQLVELGWQPGKLEVIQKTDLGTPLTGDAVTGSYLIPETFAAEVLRIVEEQSELLQAVRTVDMPTRKINYPKKGTGFTFTYVASESTDLTEKNPTFTEVELAAKTYAGWIGVSQEFLEDSLVNVGEYFTSLCAEGAQSMLENQLLCGTGSPVTGVLNHASVETCIMGAGKVGFSDIEFDDLKDMIATLTTKAKRRDGVFILHPTMLDVIMGLKDANGRFLWHEPAGERPATIWTYPYLLCDEMPELSESDTETAFLAFGNPRHLIRGNRIAFEFKMFDSTYYAVQNLEVFFRCRMRVGLEVAMPEGFVVLKTAAS